MIYKRLVCDRILVGKAIGSKSKGIRIPHPLCTEFFNPTILELNSGIVEKAASAYSCAKYPALTSRSNPIRVQEMFKNLAKKHRKQAKVTRSYKSENQKKLEIPAVTANGQRLPKANLSTPKPRAEGSSPSAPAMYGKILEKSRVFPFSKPIVYELCTNNFSRPYVDAPKIRKKMTPTNQCRCRFFLCDCVQNIDCLFCFS